MIRRFKIWYNVLNARTNGNQEKQRARSNAQGVKIRSGMRNLKRYMVINDLQRNPHGQRRPQPRQRLPQAFHPEQAGSRERGTIMKIERKIVDPAKGIIQITTSNERWYLKEAENIYIPSVTWICNVGDPKGVEFYKWLASKGWSEAESIKEVAGNKGSKVHKGVEMLLHGETIAYNSMIPNRNGVPEETTSEEYEAILSFAGWFRTLKDFKLICTEQTLFHPKNLYAGTIDLLCEISGKKWLIDLKTSKSVYRSQRMQLSAYAEALGEPVNIGILQLGYQKNKNRYKFTEIEKNFNLFLAAYEIWKDECGDEKPKQSEYPLSITLNLEASNVAW
jgi:hypothetical protein